MSESGPLLSGLCRICNNPTPKYRCPGCGTRTCSLPCYKRHQKWSQCPGKRDPTAFVKRSQLMTAAGIDHDFNFLTTLERSIDTRNKTSQEHGLLEEYNQRHRTGVASGSKLEKAITQLNIQICRAPQGMTRQRQNRTRWHPKMDEIRHKCVQWTVEWILPDETIELRQCLENAPLSSSFNALLQERAYKKRKLGLSIDVTHQPQARGSLSSTHCDSKSFAGADPEQQPKTCPESSVDNERRAPEPIELTDDIEKQYAPGFESKGSPESRIDVDEPASITSHSLKRKIETSNPKFGPEAVYFYLIKPMTAGRAKVVTPLDPSASLAGSLKNQIILEFPSVQVLEEPPQALKRDYVLVDRNLETVADRSTDQRNERETPQEPKEGKAASREPER